MRFLKQPFLALGTMSLIAVVMLGGCAGKPMSEDILDMQETQISPTGSVATPYVSEDGMLTFSHAAGFYTDTIEVSLSLANPSEDWQIYYTMDGSVPTKASTVYEAPITIEKKNGDYPDMECIRAIAISANGDSSKVSQQGYLVSENATSRFGVPVVGIWGDPKELTDAKDGILGGSHNEDRGREWEREIYIEFYSPKGELLTSQSAGARVYGGASRGTSLKSMKLYARKSYDENHKDFAVNLFGTQSASGDEIDHYKRLVLRNCGNDFQFAFLRDEYAQRLAKEAGYDNYEACTPVVGYVNGHYYNYYWAHENYCDEFLKSKYGEAPGTFYVLEGSETEKSVAESEELSTEDELAMEYNAWYEEVSKLDLTQDANYAQVTDYIDVENYLDYYAINIYICNADWPHNNYKCYRYVASEGEDYGEGVYDGRYRFLLHDMDYSFGLYGQDKVKAERNNLHKILSENAEQSAPLFRALMEREDCRSYFLGQIQELMNGVLSTNESLRILEEVDALRAPEMDAYREYLFRLRDANVEGIWTHSDHLDKYMNELKSFLRKRPDYMAKYLEQELPHNPVKE